MTVAGNDAAKNAAKFASYTIEQYINEQGPLQNPPWDPDLGAQGDLPAHQRHVLRV